MKLTVEDIKNIIDENEKMRKLIDEFKAYDKQRKAYYEKVQADLEEYSSRYLAYKKAMEVCEGDEPVEKKLKKMKLAYAQLQRAYCRLKTEHDLAKDERALIKAEEILKRYDELKAAQEVVNIVDKAKGAIKENRELRKSISELVYRNCRLKEQLDKLSTDSDVCS